MWLENRDHFFELLVGHRAEDDPHALRMELPNKCRERLRRRNIVSAIEKKASEPLQSSGPLCRVDAPHNIFSGNFQTLGSADSQRDIFKLMPAEKLRPQFLIAAEVRPAQQAI